MLNNVPGVTVSSWIGKIACTTVGETAIMSALFVGALALQLRARRYVPWASWLAVVSISIVGTLIPDTLTDDYHVRLVTSTLGFSVALAASFAAWYAVERTLVGTSWHSRSAGAGSVSAPR